MKLFVPVTTATLALAPLTAQAWSMGPRYYGAFPMLDVFPSTNRHMLKKQAELFKKQQAQFIDAFTHTSPRYEINDTDENFSVALDVPGVRQGDIHVTLEDNGSVLNIAGSRKAKDESSTSMSKFSQSFSIDPTVIIDQFEAKLLNGVLTVEAPKQDKKKDTVEIEITEVKEEAAAEEEIVNVENADDAKNEENKADSS